MKEVFDISLQGVAFKIEKDAYGLLESYLEELKSHYGKQEEEVVNDIEERISELLLEKGCTGGTVVQYHHIDEIIKVLGKPSEIDGEDTSGGRAGGKVKKRVYRDTGNCIVAGVCSGLGAYFNMDAVWVRIIFIILAVAVTAPSFFVRSFLGINMGWFGFLLLVYCILWVIIPEAKTVSQRCEMRGEPQNVDHIHKKFAQGARDVGNEMWQMGSQATGTFFSTLWRIICFAVGAILTAIGFGGIVALGIGFFGVDMFFGIPLFSMPDFLELNIGSTLWLKIFGVLTVLLPFVGMLYSGIQLCFRFKSPAWRPGLVNFLIWLVSALIFTLSAVKAFSPYYDVNVDYKEQIPLQVKNDTLYVSCPKVPGMEKAKMNMEASGNMVELFYLFGSGKDASMAVYPIIKVRRGDHSEPFIEATMSSFSKPDFYEDYTSDIKIGDIATLQDSLLTVKPAVYSRENKFAGKVQTLRIYLPDSTVVILKEPIDFTFGKSRSFRTGIRK